MFAPIRRRLTADERAAGAGYHRQCPRPRTGKLVETLEDRTLLSVFTVSHSNLTFDTESSGNQTALNNVFAHTATSATFAGTISGPSGESVSGTFSVNNTSPASSTYNVTASNFAVALPNNIIQIAGASATLTLNDSGISGPFSTVNVGVNSSLHYANVDQVHHTTNHTTANVAVSGGSKSFNWDTVSGHDNNVKIVVASGTLTFIPGQSLNNGTFTFERAPNPSFPLSFDRVHTTVSGVSASLGSGLVSLSNASGNIDLTSSSVNGTGTAASSTTI